MTAGEYLVTLPNRIGLKAGVDLLSIFVGQPATFTLEVSELAPDRKSGLAEAESTKFCVAQAEPEFASDERGAELLQDMSRWLSLSDLPLVLGVGAEFSGLEGRVISASRS